MQDIDKRQREREWAIANTRDLFRGSSTLALHPRLRHTKDFHYARSQWISPQCRNTYNPSDSLVPYTRKPTSLPRPHLKQRVRTRTRNTESPLGPETIANALVRLLKGTKMNFGDLNSWSPKILSQQTPIGRYSNGKLKCCARRQRKEMVEENSRNLFWTLLIKLSFWLKIFALNQVEENSK